MKVIVDKSFDKDISNINDKKLLNALADCIEEIQGLTKLSEIKNCNKLKGSKNAYRVRIGFYRIGFVYENQAIELVRFLHRSKIYEYFPD